MPESKPKKIVYLFGAGATHAELKNLDSDLKLKRRGLLITHVSDRVIERASRNPKYLKNLEMVSATSGSLNIELLITLIENSKIHDWESKTRYLKKLVKRDIKTVLTDSLTKGFYLHKALFEFHEHEVTKTQEEVTGLISLNYDEVLDEAYKKILHKDPNYCFSLDTSARSSKNIPLLKLHGSFNWNRRMIRGRKRTIEIIPLGSNKNYLHSPYSFIWNRALEVLIECDTLRVIGCSLSPNDAHLIDLLFRAHLEKGTPFVIEIIGFETTGKEIQDNYGFFPRIKRMTEIEGDLEGGLIPDPHPTNPFSTWLKYKSIRTLKEEPLKGTQYLKSVIR